MAERIRKAGSYTGGDVHINTGLTEISVAYKQRQVNYVANQVFPGVPVQKQSDKIFKFDKNDLLRNEAGIRAPGTKANHGSFDIDSSDTYFCDPHAWAHHIPMEYLANSDIDRLEDQAAEYVMEKLMIDREVDWVTNFFTTNLWADQGTPNDATGSSSSSTWPYFIYFSDQANSDPQNTIILGQESIQQNTGYKPNILVAGLQVHNQLRKHADLKEQVKYTSSANIGQDYMAQFFDIGKYVVGSSVRATNVEGGTAAYSFNLGKNMLLVYAPEAPGLFTPSGGYIFEWVGLNGLGYDVSMDSKYDVGAGSTNSLIVEGNMAYDAKLLCNDLGVFFSGAVA